VTVPNTQLPFYFMKPGRNTKTTTDLRTTADDGPLPDIGLTPHPHTSGVDGSRDVTRQM